MAWWIYLLIWLASFFISKKAGLSNAGAALAATGVTGVTAYATGDLQDWLTNVGEDTVNNAPEGAPADSTTGVPSGTTFLGRVVDTAGNVLESWGPAGTSMVIGTTGLVSSGIMSKPWFWPLVIGAGIFILAK